MIRARGAQIDLVSRRQALILLGAAAAVQGVDAAEQAITQPASLDHINIRVSNGYRGLEEIDTDEGSGDHFH